MLPRFPVARYLLTLAVLLAASVTSAQDDPVRLNSCLQCHFAKQEGFNASHAFAAGNCTICHAGNSAAFEEESAHEALLAYPGDLSNAARTCGQCHADRVNDVIDGNLMHTGHGMVRVTRDVIDGSTGAAASINLQSLGHSVADSMLRKLCASCHLGQPKTEHAHNVMFDRGGGCLACHVNEYPESAHPELTTAVSDARCFGCHSRSGRVSLSYTGLAEIETPSGSGAGVRLPDGRQVERMPADVHYLAGITCVDCHTAGDVMGNHGDARNQRDAVQARCTDCHEPQSEIDAHGGDHERLTCAACHSQWAPQCFGCHMEYDPDGEQWDHLEREITAGRWHEERWDVRNGLPALGVNASGKVDVFVPGMIMTVNHPDLDEGKFVRLFGPLSPHTIGPARSCESCHRSTTALGLGEGRLYMDDGELRFEPAGELLRDGLAADAWTNVDNSLGGRAPFSDQRPLNPAEIRKIIEANIEQPAGIQAR